MLLSLRTVASRDVGVSLKARSSTISTRVICRRPEARFSTFNRQNGSNDKQSARNLFLGAAVSAVLAVMLMDSMRGLHSLQTVGSSDPRTHTFYSREEVAKRNNKKDGIWVTYKDGVYDITTFVDNHPGGDRILRAAGRSVDPFWSLYKQHLTPYVLKVLEEHRIGTLSDYEPEQAEVTPPQPQTNKNITKRTENLSPGFGRCYRVVSE